MVRTGPADPRVRSRKRRQHPRRNSPPNPALRSDDDHCCSISCETRRRLPTTRSRIAKDHQGWRVRDLSGFQARSQSASGAPTFRTHDSISLYQATCWSLPNHRLTVHRKTTTQEHGSAATAGLSCVTAWRTHRRVDLARRRVFGTLHQCSLNGSQSQRKKVA
jgi:hypothetical protein